MDDKTKLALGLIALDTGMDLIRQALDGNFPLDLDDAKMRPLLTWLTKDSPKRLATLCRLLAEIDNEIRRL